MLQILCITAPTATIFFLIHLFEVVIPGTLIRTHKGMNIFQNRRDFCIILADKTDIDFDPLKVAADRMAKYFCEFGSVYNGVIFIREIKSPKTCSRAHGSNDVISGGGKKGIWRSIGFQNSHSSIGVNF